MITYDKSKPVAVLGCGKKGTMSHAIARSLRAARIPVIAQSYSQASIDAGRKKQEKRFAGLVGRGKMNQGEVDEIMQGITWVHGYHEILATCGAVIESTPENDEKPGVFSALSDVADPECVFLSNTSAKSGQPLQDAVKKNPGRVMGGHYSNPGDVQVGVELALYKLTTPETAAMARSLMLLQGKKPHFMFDRRALVLNRLLIPFVNDAHYLAETGLLAKIVDGQFVPCTPEEALVEIDQIMPETAGLKSGPITTAKFIGYEVVESIMLSINELEPNPKHVPAPLVVRFAAEERRARLAAAA